MNRAAFRELSLRQKLQWIAQYYGAAIVLAVVAVAMGIGFFTAVFGPGEKCTVKVMILDDRQTADNCRLFSEELGAMLGGECEVTSYAPSAMYEMQAFAVRLTSDALDVVIAPEAQMRELIENGYLRGMEKLEANSRYQAITRGGEADGADIYIGLAARTKNERNASETMRYFSETGK